MVFKNHLIVATAVYAVAVKVMYEFGTVDFGWHFLWGYILALAGCCLPDIDHPSSTVGRRVKWLSWPIYVVFGHRGITHSGIIILLIAGLWWHFQWPFILWLGVGWVLHLVGDYLTDSGIPLMWPSKRRYRFPVYADTSGYSEPVMVLIVVTAAVSFILFFKVV